MNFFILLFFQFFCFLNILLIPFYFIFQPPAPFLHAVWGSSVSVLVILVSLKQAFGVAISKYVNLFGNIFWNFLGGDIFYLFFGGYFLKFFFEILFLLNFFLIFFIRKKTFLTSFLETFLGLFWNFLKTFFDFLKSFLTTFWNFLKTVLTLKINFKTFLKIIYGAIYWIA